MHQTFSTSILRTGAVLVMAWAAAGPARAETPSLDDILARGEPLSSDSVIRGEFRQEKHLAELDGPLVSTGSFTVAPGEGLIWRVRQPIESTLILTGERLVERVEGRETMSLSAEERPALRMMATAMLAVFESRAGPLEDYFDVQVEAADARCWRVRLEPRGEGAGEFLRVLRLEGDEHVRRIEIEEGGGDRSVIHVQKVTESRGDLSAEEREALRR